MVVIKVQTQQPNITVQPSGQTISAGATATMSITATSPDGGTLTYQWCSNTLAQNYSGTNISGATNASYTTGVLSAGTYYYYCDVKNSDGVSTDSLASDLVTITVNAPSSTPAQKPTITLQPKDAYYYLPDSPAIAALTVTATSGDGGALSYQWYSINTQGAAGTSIGGATSSSYTPLTSPSGSKYYYCVITNTKSGNSTSIESGAVIVIMDDAPPYSGPAGTGTISDPLKVYDVTTLKRVATGNPSSWTRTAYYEQVAHIDLSSEANWTPLAQFQGFQGGYNGGNFIISNLTLNNTSSTQQQAFFCAVSSGGILENVRLINCDITNNPYTDTGGLVGVVNGGTVRNCYVSGSVFFNQTTQSGGDGNVGGLAGYVTNTGSGIIENCYAMVNVTGRGYVASIGGLVGQNWGTVRNCYATGNVLGDATMNSTDRKIGGIVGLNGGLVENCYATGNVSNASTTTANVKIGGVVGDNSYNGGSVENCYATGNVSGGEDSGGVVGYRGTTKCCIALNTNINGTYCYRVGNLSGYLSTNCHGRSDMKKNEVATTWTNNTANGQDGADITATEWNSASWWTSTANFSSTVWDITNGKLPTLKNMPAGMQNPVVQPLP
jgi:plastocyanin